MAESEPVIASLEDMDSEIGAQFYSSYPDVQPWRSFYPPNNLLAEIEQTIQRTGARTFSYIGLADEKILRLLVGQPGLKVTVVDWFDYWNCALKNYWEHDPADWEAEWDHPEWLRGVRFQVTGIPQCADIFFVDVSMFAEEPQIAADNLFGSGRREDNPRGVAWFRRDMPYGAKCLFLVGPATRYAGGERYEWIRFDGFTVGYYKRLTPDEACVVKE